MPRKNLLSLFQEFESYGRDVAVVQRHGYRRETWTYEKLWKSAALCARKLKKHGIEKGDRVMIWGPNCAEWMAAFWGCLLLGAVAVPMDDGATSAFVLRVIQDAGVKLMAVSRRKPHVQDDMPTLFMEDLADTFVDAVTAWAALNPTIERTDIAQILYTSGTTGEPRGVVLTHGNFLANLEPLEKGIAPYRKYERWFHPLRFVTLVPLSHVFGQFMTLFVPPLLGATVVFELSANPSEIMRTAKRERATALISVPRMLDLLRSSLFREFESSGKALWLQKTLQKSKEKKFLRRVWMFRQIHRRFGWKFWAFISGGAALNSDTEEFFKRIGHAVVQGYGMTETASLISLNHPFRAAEGSVGKILPGREFRLAEDGEILVCGENVASGYWRKETQQAEKAETENNAGHDGWLRTGDIGELDAEGNLRFRGRKKSVIVTAAGLNIYPEDLEAVLRKQDRVRDCVVIPLQRGGNAEACGVLLMEEQSEDAARLAIECANRSLAEYQRMQSWITWPQLDFPRTATGKPRLSEIAKQTVEILSKPDVSPKSDSATDEISALIAKISRGKNRSVSLEQDLNLSSLDRVELLSALEEKFHVELNETAFAAAKTTADVEQLLQQPGSRRTEYAYPRWTQNPLVKLWRLAVYYSLVWPATQILGHPKIVGRENLKDLRGPALFVSNHITRRADIGLILAALPRRYRHSLATAMGGETLREMRNPGADVFLFKRWAYQLGYWLVTSLFNVFPLPQFSGFRESFRFAGESIDRGYSILVFPEGEVNNSETGEMIPFRNGIGLLAESLRVPIVPMRLDGVWGMKREGRRFAHPGEITVHIGSPVEFSLDIPPEEVSFQLQNLVAAL